MLFQFIKWQKKIIKLLINIIATMEILRQCQN
jgi:hypothetical protein